MKTMSKRMEKKPKPNFVGSPNIDPQSSERYRASVITQQRVNTVHSSVNLH